MGAVSEKQFEKGIGLVRPTDTAAEEIFGHAMYVEHARFRFLALPGPEQRYERMNPRETVSRWYSSLTIVLDFVARRDPVAAADAANERAAREREADRKRRLFNERGVIYVPIFEETVLTAELIEEERKTVDPAGSIEQPGRPAASGIKVMDRSKDSFLS